MEFGLGLSFDVSANGRAFDGIDAKLADASNAMAEAASILHASVMANFAAGGRPTAWPELAESTVEQKGHAMPLIKTGRLVADIYAASGPDFADVAAGAPYAVFQQAGGPHTPARPFVMIQEDDMVAILNAVKRRLMEAV